MSIEIGQALLAIYELLENKFRKEVERSEHQVSHSRCSPFDHIAKQLFLVVLVFASFERILILQLLVKRKALEDSVKRVRNLERANTQHLQQYAEMSRKQEALEKVSHAFFSPHHLCISSTPEVTRQA